MHVAACAMNQRQIVLATTTGELVYFEVDAEGELNEYMERKALGVPVTSVSMAAVPEGRQRTPYLAIGCEDQTVRIVSLAPDTCMDTISIQALTAVPSSICVAEILDGTIDKVRPTLFVNIGLVNGVLLRTVLDSTTGQLTDTRTRFLGPKAVELRKATVQGQPSVLALSTRTWLNYVYQGQLQFDPLIFEMLDNACGLSAEVCPEGIMGVTGDTLR
jgi:splicing factor 3B subunit 3